MSRPPPPILSGEQANLRDQLESHYRNKLRIPDTLMTSVTDTLMDWKLDERGFSTDGTHEALTSAVGFARWLRIVYPADPIRSLLDEKGF